jgi:Asp/Glu/hydantoin racemase
VIRMLRDSAKTPVCGWLQDAVTVSLGVSTTFGLKPSSSHILNSVIHMDMAQCQIRGLKPGSSCSALKHTRTI